jgi:hypothetical protein
MQLTMSAQTNDTAPRLDALEAIDLERVVIDPEYRARVRDRLNRADSRHKNAPAPIRSQAGWV